MLPLLSIKYYSDACAKQRRVHIINDHPAYTTRFRDFWESLEREENETRLKDARRGTWRDFIFHLWHGTLSVSWASLLFSYSHKTYTYTVVTAMARTLSCQTKSMVWKYSQSSRLDRTNIFNYYPVFIHFSSIVKLDKVIFMTSSECLFYISYISYITLSFIVSDIMDCVICSVRFRVTRRIY